MLSVIIIPVGGGADCKATTTYTAPIRSLCTSTVNVFDPMLFTRTFATGSCGASNVLNVFVSIVVPPDTAA